MGRTLHDINETTYIVKKRSILNSVQVTHCSLLLGSHTEIQTEKESVKSGPF